MGISQARLPLQTRSSESLEKVINAAGKILEDHTYEDLTITRIVADSGVSVGSIYARFSNKEGIFNTLVTRFMNDTLQEFQNLDREVWASDSLDKAIDHLVDTNAKLYRRHRGILRAITLRTRLENDSELTAALQKYNQSVGTNLLQLMRLHADHIEHSDSEEAISVAIEVITAMLWTNLVLANKPPSSTRPIDRAKKLVKIYLQPGSYSL